MELNKIYQGNSLEVLKTFPDSSIDCCVTSPPYFGLRDYGNSKQIGLEKSPDKFVQKLVQVFDEVKRVLKPDGNLWLNLGDSYAGSGKGTNADGNFNPKIGAKQKTHQGTHNSLPKYSGLKSKDLIGIPWMVAFALRSSGYYLRQDNIWAKAYTTLQENFGSVMPESVVDRCVKSHEYLFHLSKSAKYYFDIHSIKKPVKESSSKRLQQDIASQKGSMRVPGKTNGTMKAAVGSCMARNGTNVKGHSGDIQKGNTANKRSVWHHNPSNLAEAHFATFPEDLIVDCIKAGCRGGGTVLDPFMGAGTTALVARKLGRNFVGIELNPDYIKIAERRLKKELGLFI